MIEHRDTRLAVILEVERFALYARYIAYAILTPLFFLRPGRAEIQGAIIVGILFAAHNIFVHWALSTRRYAVFSSIWNLAANLIEISIIVAITGGDTSDGYMLYVFLVIGFGIYVRKFRLTLLVAGLCCAAYAVVLLGYWRIGALDESEPALAARFFGIIVTGWLVGAVSRVLVTSEREASASTRALAVSEATLRTILDNTADPILVFDETERIVDANDRATEFLGVSRDRLLGQPLRAFVFDDGTFSGKLAGLQATGEYHGDQTVLNADGEERTVDFRAQSFVQDGRQFFVVVAHDITEQKDLQEATRLANLDLERLNRELRQVNHLRTGFLTSMSQKLRSPMSVIMGYVEMLLDEELGELAPEQRKALYTCRRSAMRILRLVDESLELRGADDVRSRQHPPDNSANGAPTPP